MTDKGEASVEGKISLRVFVDGTGHRANDAEIVGAAFSKIGKQVRDWDAAFASGRKIKWAAKYVAVIVELGPFDFYRHLLSVHVAEARFGVKGVDVGHAPRHVAENDSLCFRAKIGVAFSFCSRNGTERI
jgi:hypothetical protein